MNDEPISPELTPLEIVELEKYLSSVETRNLLLQTQSAIVDIIQKNKYIKDHCSTIRPRDDIKNIERVIEKINDHRRAGDISYDAEHCRDLIGAQVICPYPDDVESIIDWIYDKDRGRKFFTIVSKIGEVKKKQQQRISTTGYRAYHICLKLKKDIAKARSLPTSSEKEHFELQVKTTLEAGWDFKTHDVSYKAINANPELQRHMKLISNSLDSIDQQTVLLRDRLLEEQHILSELRIVAIRLLFHLTMPRAFKEQLRIDKKSIEALTPDDLSNLESAIEEEKQTNGISIMYTTGLALLALCFQSVYKQETALSCASYMVNQASERNDESSYISCLRIRALLRWAFHKTRFAVDDSRYIVKHTSDIDDMNSYVYFVSELYEPSTEDIRLANRCLKSMEDQEGFQFKDTIGAYYISIGENIEKLHKGLELVREAKESARGKPAQEMVDAFCNYHEYKYLRRLSRLRRSKTQ